jgi:glycosyltransferase involved in cell wall biosynthesis
MSVQLTPADVSAVVCTRNSVLSIEQCLRSLQAAGVAEIIVVDARSTDGTRQVAEGLASLVLQDEGIGLGAARNLGITQTTKPLILNMGSDNVLPPRQLQKMIDLLAIQGLAGVSAQTQILGANYPARGLNAWRKGRFPSGPAKIIGTPTLFQGDLLRANPYNPTRRFSDDSELCERLTEQFGSRFAISDAEVLEIGKTSWSEVFVRCRMYGESDAEVFRDGREQGWSAKRTLQSLAHPVKADFLEPMSRLHPTEAVVSAPFLGAFTALRYAFWARKSLDG